MLLDATNEHLPNLAKDTAPQLIWHNERIHGIACTHRSQSPGSEINTMLALHQSIQSPLPTKNYKWWVRIQKVKRRSSAESDRKILILLETRLILGDGCRSFRRSEGSRQHTPPCFGHPTRPGRHVPPSGRMQENPSCVQPARPRQHVPPCFGQPTRPGQHVFPSGCISENRGYVQPARPSKPNTHRGWCHTCTGTMRRRTHREGLASKKSTSSKQSQNHNTMRTQRLKRCSDVLTKQRFKCERK